MTVSRVDDRVDLDRRLRAHLLDHVLLVAVAASAALVLALAGLPTAGVIAGATTTVLAALLGLGVTVGVTGATPGGAWVGTRLRSHDGGALGAGRGIVRTLLLALVGWGSVGVGWLLLALSVLRDPLGRSWLDRAVGSVRLPVTVGAPDLALVADVAETVPVPEPRRPEPRELPQRWWLDREDGDPVEVVDRVALGLVEFARMPDGALAVRDAGSPGGTLLVRRGVARTLSPGRPATVLPGDRLRVGERWLRVREPRPAPAPG